jgi:outer membrane protein TolC
MRKNLIFLLMGGASMVLAGCATFSPDGGFAPVEQMTRERVGQAPIWQRTQAQTQLARERVAELLRQPLTPDSAVEVALLNNQGLQADLHQLGIAEADLVRAGRLRNPSFSFGRLAGSGAVEIERAVVFDLLGLVTFPVASEVEQQRFQQAQLRAAYDAVGLAAEARSAYFAAVAAQELLKYHGQVRLAAEASNELAAKMVEAGNFPKLTQMREQAFYAEATSQLARAGQQATAHRERLTRLLGLGGEERFALPERLPELPTTAAAAANAEQTAMDKRLDILMAKRGTESVARALGLTRATRMINVLQLGYQNKSATGVPRENGYEVELELPLFDFGSARLARAEAAYMQALARAAEVALNAQSEVRESYAAYRTAFELARHYRDEIVPLRKRISEENLLRYNGMLIGPFELLADAREQVASITAYVEALRDYWVAETRLQTAISGRSPGSGAMPAPAASNAPAASGGH